MEISDLYLVFVRRDGITSDDKYLYTLEFSLTPDVVWGEHWHICPAGAVPNITPNEESISAYGQLKSPVELTLVQYNTCFSMQDCIDSIIPLAYYDEGETSVLFPFGQHYDDTEKQIEKISGSFELTEIPDKNDDKANELIDNLIEKI